LAGAGTTPPAEKNWNAAAPLYLSPLVEIIAHRGASAAAPENTLAALDLAWAEGADAVECDVHLTADGQLAVIHDPNTLRTTGSTRLVATATLEELQTLDAGAWKHAKYAGERIPALDQWLARVPPGKRVFVEIKGGPALVAALERTVARCPLAPRQIAVISFDLATATAAKAQRPDLAAYWIIERNTPAGRHGIAELIDRARAARIDGLDLEECWPIDADFVQQIHRAGIKLYVWTLDDPVRARRLMAAGIDGITTNCPGRLRARLAR
jgi:glycerophosphoryl diester phosphodiesterase